MRARSVRAFLCVSVVFVAVLIAWLTALHPLAPDGTLPEQIIALFAGYVILLLSALAWSHRPPRLARRGREGWATVVAVRPLQPRQLTGELTEIRLRLVVPGAPPYGGLVVRMLAPHERAIFRPGETLPARVDPRDRDHVLLQKRPMPH